LSKCRRRLAKPSERLRWPGNGMNAVRKLTPYTFWPVSQPATLEPTPKRPSATIGRAYISPRSSACAPSSPSATLASASSIGAPDVGAEAGSAAAAAVRGAIAAAREIGGDLGRISGLVLNGTFGTAREIGSDLMDLVSGGDAKRPLAKATSRRRSRTSERERTTRGSV